MVSNHQLKVINHANDTKKKGHLRLSGLLAGATAVLVTVSAGVSHAQSGTPDPTFGTNGRVLTTFGGSGVDEATAVAVQPDCKIVVVGTSFGGRGSFLAVTRAARLPSWSITPTSSPTATCRALRTISPDAVRVRL